MRQYTRDMQQQAMSFLVSQLTYIEPTVYRIQYPELLYPKLIPVDTTGDEWAKSITFFSVDMVGRADWFNSAANDVPLADITREKHEVGIEMAAIGYRYNVEELAQSMKLSINLGTERAAAARRAYEEFVNNVALYGDTRKGWAGLTNSTVIPIITVSGGTWATKAGATTTAMLIAADVNGALTNVWASSLTVELADTLLLPLQQMTLLANVQVPNTTMNVLEWISKNNMYTQQTGQQLTILGLRGLDTAGSGGTGRMIAYRRNPEVLKLHVPMPHRFIQVWQRGPLVFDVPGIFRLGGVEIRRPGAMRYVDGI